MASSKRVGFLMVLLTIFSFWATATWAQSDCTNVIISLAPCLSYVTGSSSTAPSPSCCSQLASGVKSSPRCLCSLLNGGGSSLGVSINQTLALALPGACNVETPPVSRCNGGSPAASPSDTTAGAGSTVNPSTGASASNAKIINMPRQLVIVIAVFMASYALTAGSF